MGTACYTSSLIPEADSVPINQVLKEGWKTWSKYQRYFPKKKMIFRIIGSEENDCTIKILLIHKEHFRNIVFKHQKLFESVLGQKIDITKMLKSFEHDEDPIRTVLKNNHLLLGILYGFGVHNSQRFLARWEEVEKLRSCHKFRSQREMYESIGNELTSTLENENHPILNLPVFSVDPLDEETRELRIQYEREREDILKKWTGRDLLEIAMKEWK